MEMQSGGENEREKLLSEINEAKSIKARVDKRIDKLVRSRQSISSHTGINLSGQRRLASEVIEELEAELNNLVE